MINISFSLFRRIKERKKNIYLYTKHLPPSLGCLWAKNINLFTSSWSRNLKRKIQFEIFSRSFFLIRTKAENYLIFIHVRSSTFYSCLSIERWFPHEERFPNPPPFTLLNVPNISMIKMPTQELVSPKKVLLSSELWIKWSWGDGKKKKRKENFQLWKVIVKNPIFFSFFPQKESNRNEKRLGDENNWKMSNDEPAKLLRFYIHFAPHRLLPDSIISYQSLSNILQSSNILRKKRETW